MRWSTGRRPRCRRRPRRPAPKRPPSRRRRGRRGPGSRRCVGCVWTWKSPLRTLDGSLAAARHALGWTCCDEL
ncbi:MAG: hypothetical protein DI563_08180 [Variovorax paradoxus]|uniref:Uncharacterized protein n=1 Tax=Variovorax paradoxus TaxID=34073 RepID=A0A2W5RZP2_VARPD|nr:MAG: hypothetical protein DI563_08180 [Variovorax paradoxus]